MKAALPFLLMLLGIVAPAGAAADSDPALDFIVAQSLVQEGAYQEALELFADLVEAVPADPFVRIEYSKLLFRLGRLDDAAVEAAAARELAPNDPDALRLFGQIHLRWSDRNPEALTLAQEAFERLREVEPTAIEPLVTLGQIYLSRGRFPEARGLFSELLEWRPGDRMLVSFLLDAVERAGPDERSRGALENFVDRDPAFERAALALAELQGMSGDHEGAAATLMAAAAAGESDVDVERRLAFELYRAGRPEEALAAIERALEAQPGESGSRYLKAMVLLSLSRHDDSIDVLQGVLEDQPDHWEVADFLARLLEGKGREGEAVEVLERVAERLVEADREPEARAARLARAQLEARRGEWESVLALTGSLVEAGGEPVPEAIDLRAEALAETGRAEEALALLAPPQEGALPPALRARRAEILLESEREEEAVTELAAIAATGELEDLVLAAEVYQRSSRFADAVPLLERALAEDSDSVQLLFRLGASYERTDRHQDAESRFRELLELEPEFAPALNYLGYMWADLGENLDEALELVRRAVALDPENGAYVDSLGWAYFRLGRLEEARGHLERAAELVPDDAVIYEHLGDLYEALGKRDRAAERYRKAISLDGENREQVERKLLDLDESR